jgi:peptidoglycan/xylan/chitin deacetylase (PgdA/CDA1 family)
MASIRDFTIKYLSAASKVISTRLLIASTHQKLVLPFYHAVSDQKLPHIDHLYRVKTTKEFIDDLEFLLRYFTPVDVFQIRNITSESKKSCKPAFLLSFDDGLREFHDVIAPILIKKGIPAVCFLNSAFVDNRDLFFRYKASLLISYLNENPRLYSDPSINSWMARNSVSNVEQWILSVEYDNKAKLDELAAVIGYNYHEYLNAVQPYLTTVQINKLIKDGFHFGSHSIDHPVYRFISFAEQLKQTSESLQYIRNTFNLNYSLFAFPFTDYQVSDRFFQTIFSNNIVDLSFGGAGLKKERYPGHFQRIAFERGKLKAKDIYKVESIYSALQSIIGKNVIHRR